MEEAKPIESGGAFGIPKWIMRKGTRYEVDDFIVSPPSNEDGGFFHLRYGRAPSPRPSTYDRINQELNMTVEVKDGGPVLSSGGAGEGVTSPTATLNISSRGLSVQGSSEASPEDRERKESTVKPLLVLPFKFGDYTGEAGSNATDETSEGATPSPVSEEYLPAVSELPSPVEKGLSEITLEDTNGLSGGHPAEPPAEIHPSIMRKISREPLRIFLGEKVNEKSGQQTKSTSVITPPFVTPLTTPQSSPRAKRKISGVVVEQNNMATPQNYFFTKPFTGNQQESGGAVATQGTIGNAVGLSASAAQGVQKLEDGANQTFHIDTSNMVIGKKRQRPKASKLREMNFWAPTSM